jgi:DNA replication protein DnaC
MERTEHLKGLLKSLCLPCFVENYNLLAERAEKESINHVGYLYELTQLECERRFHQRIKRLIQQAKLPRDKRLSDFIIARIPGLSPSLIHRLAEGEFIDRCENILIFGNPGSGKTHLSIALAHEWCLKGRRILYTTTATLTQELLRAKLAAQLDIFITGGTL